MLAGAIITGIAAVVFILITVNLISMLSYYEEYGSSGDALVLTIILVAVCLMKIFAFICGLAASIRLLKLSAQTAAGQMTYGHYGYGQQAYGQGQYVPYYQPPQYGQPQGQEHNGEQPAEESVCASCGGALEPGVRFCTRCGAKVENSNGAEDTNKM